MALLSERNQALTRENNAHVIAAPGNVHSKNLWRPLDVRNMVATFGRSDDFVRSDQAIERSRRKLAEHVNQDERIIAAPLLNLLDRPFSRNTRRAVGVIWIAIDLDHMPQPAILRAGPVQRPGQMRRVASLDDVPLLAGRQSGIC